MYIQSIQKRLTLVVMYLCILNIEHAKKFGGNFHVNEPHKLISLLVLTQDIIFRLKITFQRRSLLYGASIATKKVYAVHLHENSPKSSLHAQCSRCINT